MKKLLKLTLAFLLIITLVACAAPTVDEVGPKINGVKLEKYLIVYSDEDTDYSKRAAEYIQGKVLERTGIQLNVAEDDIAKSENEIVVGETNRDISRKLETPKEGVKLATLYDSGSVALKGDKFVIAATAYYFIETYITSKDFDAQIPSTATVNDPIVKEAYNYILLIGDGMGVYQTKLFDAYDSIKDKAKDISDGENAFYGYKLPYSGFARTDSLSGLTDSAAAGTALATGTKTKNGYIGRDKDLKDLKSLTVLAYEQGKSTAVMSTEVSTGATPASFSAHSDNRNNTDEIKISQYETIIKYGTVISCDIGNSNYTVKGIEAVEKGITDTLSALEKKSEKGFFLMYEEAYIDKNCHSNDMDKAFLAVVRFNQAIGRFMEYAFYHPNTFLLITADHETGDLKPNGDGKFEFNSTNHSRADVPVFAYGFGGELFDQKTVENVQIPKTIANFWGVHNFGDTTDQFSPLN